MYLSTVDQSRSHISKFVGIKLVAAEIENI